MILFLFIIFGLPVIIALAAAYSIYILVRNKLTRVNNKHPMLIARLVAAGSFFIIGGTIFYLIIININFTR